AGRRGRLGRHSRRRRAGTDSAPVRPEPLRGRGAVRRPRLRQPRLPPGPSAAVTGPGTLLLGIDAGNSKTVAVVADASGEVRGYGRAGNGDIYGALSETHAVAEVVAAIERALQMASGGIDHAPVVHA